MFQAFFELWSKNGKSKFKIFPIDLKFSWIVKKDLKDFFSEIAIHFDNFWLSYRTKIFEFVNFLNFCSIKPLVFTLKSQNLNTI